MQPVGLDVGNGLVGRMRSRKARRRGGKAVKRGVSREQVPVLAAADRGGAMVSAVLPAVSAAALEGALEPVVETDVAPVSDGAAGYPPCAAALGVRREALNAAAGERVRGAFHIQTVNGRHGRLKGFCAAFAASRPSISTVACAGSTSSDSPTPLPQEPASAPP